MVSENGNGFQFTEMGKNLSFVPKWEEVKEMLEFCWDSFFKQDVSSAVIKKANKLIDQVRTNWKDAPGSVSRFFDGLVIAPLMISLHKHLVNWDYHQSISHMKQHQCSDEAWKIVSELFSLFGWTVADESNKDQKLSNRGKFILERALNMGVAVSYSPLLQQSKQLFFGIPSEVLKLDSQGNETHVDRTLNVIGSGSMHGNYFDALCQQIEEIFDDGEFESQPRFICDMGCGDGHLLASIYKHIVKQTKRGQVLDKYPLSVIGVDFNHAALEETRKTLTKEQIPHKVIHGDIGNPEQLLKDLVSQCGSDEGKDVVHVRSFLDHDRPFLPITNHSSLAKRKEFCNNLSSGCFVKEDGSVLANSELIQNLVEHLSRWSSILNKHGGFILEVHCLEPEISEQYLDMCSSLYFDACQSMSRQWLVESHVWILAAAEAGLFPHKGKLKLLPEKAPYKRMSLTRFVTKPFSIRLANQLDADSLVALEQKSATFHKFSIGQITLLLSERVGMNFVLESNGTICGSIYSQCVPNLQSIDSISWETWCDLKFDSVSDKSPRLLRINAISTQMEEELRNFFLVYAQCFGIPNVFIVTAEKERLCSIGEESQTLVSWFPAENENENRMDGILLLYFISPSPLKSIVPHSNVSSLSVSNEEIQNVRKEIKRTVKSLLDERGKKKFGVDVPFMELGLDSLATTQLVKEISSSFKIQLPPTILFDHPTTLTLCEFIHSSVQIHSQTPSQPPLLSTRLALPKFSENFPQFKFEQVRKQVKRVVMDLLNTQSRSSIQNTQPLMEIGLDSLGATQLIREISSIFDTPLPPTILFDFPTIDSLSKQIVLILNAQNFTNPKQEVNSIISTTKNNSNKEIAIIGMSCKFPGGIEDPFMFWEAIGTGKCMIEKVPFSRWDVDAVIAQNTTLTDSVKQSMMFGGFVKDLELFDASFFGISPTEALAMDPQQRLVLEYAYLALMDAGYTKTGIAGKNIGVFVGVMADDFSQLNTEHSHDKALRTQISGPSALSGRVSYCFGLHGPSVSYDTACSSSLVALHGAIAAINNYECDVAIVAGVNAMLSSHRSID